MASHSRVLNVDDGSRPKLSRAKRLVEKECAYEWVEEGISIRKLNLEESIKARAQQTRLREFEEAERIRLSQPLEGMEIPGVRFEPPASGLVASRIGAILSLDAAAICAGCYHPATA